MYYWLPSLLKIPSCDVNRKRTAELNYEDSAARGLQHAQATVIVVDLQEGQHLLPYFDLMNKELYFLRDQSEVYCELAMVSFRD